jgi:signal transduction histidine kinase
MSYEPNCWNGRDGILYFATDNSVTEVNPAQVRINSKPPTVSLEEFRADGKPVLPSRPGAILTTADKINPPPTMNVGPGRDDLEFDYTGLSPGSPSQVRFKYRLEGMENSWNEAGMERKAVYRHVPPGEYVFHLIACNSDSVWSSDGSLLTVIINPFFYQTLWFRSCVALLVAAVLFLSVAMLIWRWREKLQRQHELERERARIAQDLHDDLGAGLTEIGLLGGLLQDPCQFSTRKQEALECIVQRCHDLVVALDEIVWAINPRNDSFNSLGSYLCRYAQRFLEPTGIRCRLEMSVVKPDYSLNSDQRHNLFLTFKEALTNIVKHSGATGVRIKISVAKKCCLINVEDNGHGLPSIIEPGGEGLDNLHRRMAQIGGECEIINEPGRGVSVRLRLPLVD